MNIYYTYSDNRTLTRTVRKALKQANLPQYVINSIYVQSYYSSEYRVYSRTIISNRAHRMINSIWQGIQKNMRKTMIAAMMTNKPIVNNIPLSVIK